MEKIVGPKGAECYRITHESGAEVTMARHGGHLISWKTADGKERLYLSPVTEYSAGTAIRGGVPVIFPQFNEYGPFSRHGFARKLDWSPGVDGFVLRSSEATLAEWPHAFDLSIRPELTAASLEIVLTVHNQGSDAFTFQAALHTYLRVGSITECQVSGLEGLIYKNEVTGEQSKGGNIPVRFGAETDRAYFGGAVRPLVLHDETEKIAVESDSFRDAVIWNPGPDHGIGDLPKDGWRDFVCIESAQIDPGIPVEPGQTWKGAQRLLCGD